MNLTQSSKILSLVLAAVGLAGVILGFNTAVFGGSATLALVAWFLAGTAVAGLSFLLLRVYGAVRDLAMSLQDSKGSPEAVRISAEVGAVWEAIRRRNRESYEKVELLNHQIQDLALQIQLLRKQKQNAQAIIFGIRDAVLVVDPSHCLVIANQAAEALFGFQFDSSQLRPASELVRHPDLLALMDKSRQNRIPHVRRELTVERSGESAVFDCILSCVTDDKDQLTGIVAVLHDVTREKEVSRMKNDFVSHVSHELKTPLASINAYAEMLVDGEAKDPQTLKQFCSVIQTQAQRLNRLIEDILNISRIESGLVKINKQPISLSMVIHDAVEMIRSFAQEKNITVHTPPSIIFDQVYADKDMMTQVVINLLSNAVKYTPKQGEVTVACEVNDSDQVVRVQVTDTGVGIPPEDLPRLFEKFYRVEANKKMAKGTGLGLNLVKQMVEKVHQGKVFVRSTPGQGSTFGFEMPMDAPAAAAATVS
jgi:two-component system phosphate regulon sensor histidine kinase PhoR